MQKPILKKIGQSILEYAILVSIISAAFISMFVYFQRAMNARLEDLRQEYNPEYVK
jgi:Flp pilus assembly pilin Flp